MKKTLIKTLVSVACAATFVVFADVLSAEATLLATLVGSEEAPPNSSATMGEAALILNADGSLTYSVTTAGFETNLLAAYVHEGAAGAAGPVLFGLLCTQDGTSCSGTSPVLGAAEKSSVAAGKTYVNLCTEAFPDGEIRGQLVPVSLVSGMEETAVDKLSGKANHVGPATSDSSAQRGDIRISGRFRVEGGLDLEASNAVIGDLLNEMDGAGELVRRRGGEPALPILLRLASYKPRTGQATYKTIGAGLHPSCRLKIKRRSQQLFDFSLQCKAADGLTIVEAPEKCSESPSPKTDLMTSFIINAADPAMVKTLQPWACLKAQVRVRETRATDGTKKPQGQARAKALSEGSNKPPVADFRARPRRGNPPLTVTLTNRSIDPEGDALAYSWDFGDGGGSTGKNPRHTYTSAGQFVVTLVVTDGQGMASKPKRETISVKENRQPQADFESAPRKGNAPLTVTFRNRSSDLDGDVVGFTWDFGDGSGSTGKNPKHTYTSAGQFVVSLVATDDQGMTSGPRRETISVEGSRRPLADFTASPRRGVVPLTVAFTNQSSDPDGKVVAFGWNFGDGSGSVEENPTHTYTRDGQFVVTLMVTDDRGMTSGVKRDTVTVDDNEPKKEESVPDEETDIRDTNRAPRADFRVSQSKGDVPLTVAFTNISSDPDGDGLAFSWTLGDGRLCTEQSPTHTYTKAGQFVVTLMVTDDRGKTSEPKRQTISAQGGPTSRPPLVGFGADPLRGGAPLTVTFTNISSDPDGGKLTFRWTFGDGGTSASENPTHTYMKPGEFAVTLMATDDSGMTSAPARGTITVEANRLPRADFRADPRNGEVPLSVAFTNRSSDPDGDTLSFRWDFGDGTGSRETDPTHIFAGEGEFAVTLTVTDDRGASSEQPKRETIEVRGKNPSDFTTQITNPYFRMSIGKKMVYEARTEDGTERIEILIPGWTKTIMGVETLVSWDRSYLNGELIEDTRDYIAQDREGNVWYFGEHVDNYVDGLLANHHGAWIGGVDGALPGIWMKANPRIGDEYRQEYYKGKAEDMGRVDGLGVRVTTAAGKYTDCVKIFEWTRLESATAYKYHCKVPGGTVLEEKDHERVELIELTEDGAIATTLPSRYAAEGVVTP